MRPGQQASPAAAYAGVLPVLMETAIKKGYALAVHGSMGRDLDLMAMPWVEDACSDEELVEALAETVGGVIPVKKSLGQKENREVRAHGRICWVIHLEAGLYLDLSIMPRSRPN